MAAVHRPLLPTVVRLDEEAAVDAQLTGSKAAALARASSLGLPVLTGFVITTAASSEATTGCEVRAAWQDLTNGGRDSVVVRSSSTAEDLEGSSMAGRYESVVDVAGWEAFVEAVDAVLGSRRAAVKGNDALTGDEPLAVLVQPMLRSGAGGVMFGVDPATGRDDRIVIAASREGPDAVVSGRVNGSRYVLDRQGDVVEVEESPDGATLGKRQLAELVELAGRVADGFGGHQDVEWALRPDGSLVLLQSRPVTTKVVGAPVGPLFGRGPVAETFPDPLSPLEEDLWVPPLRNALRQALRLSGAAKEDRLSRTPLVVTVRGHVAVDLEATGEAAGSRTVAQRLDPRPRLSRLLSAWRVGRLRAALPGLAEDVVRNCDDALAAVPSLHALSDRQLLAVLTRGAHALASLHAHEVLMGQLVDPDAPRLVGTSVALRVLAHARSAGTAEDDIARRHPVVLTLAPPRIAPTVALPKRIEPPPWTGGKERDRDALLREALRLRIRWLHELTGRAAWTLGERLTERAVLREPGEVRSLRIDDLRSAVLDGTIGDAPPVPTADADEGVPVRFRLTRDGDPVAVLRRGDGNGGTGAGGGRGRGVVSHDVDDVVDGSVLVVQTLDASLAAALPRLAGLVAETGSVLAHVAILAREAGVPTVVGATGATRRYAAGCVVRIDGDNGDIELLEGP